MWPTGWQCHLPHDSSIDHCARRRATSRKSNADENNFTFLQLHALIIVNRTATKIRPLEGGLGSVAPASGQKVHLISDPASIATSVLRGIVPKIPEYPLADQPVRQATRPINTEPKLRKAFKAHPVATTASKSSDRRGQRRKDLVRAPRARVHVLSARLVRASTSKMIEPCNGSGVFSGLPPAHMAACRVGSGSADAGSHRPSRSFSWSLSAVRGRWARLRRPRCDSCTRGVVAMECRALLLLPSGEGVSLPEPPAR